MTDKKKFINQEFHDNAWLEMKNEFKTFYLKHKEYPKQKDNIKLYSWVFYQIKCFKKNELSDYRKNILLEIDNSFFLKEKSLDNWYNEANKVKTYFYDNKKLPSIIDDELLSKWIKKEILHFKKGIIGKSKYNFLISITPDFFQGNNTSDYWLISFNEFKKYFTSHNVFPTKKETTLHKWRSTQIRKYKDAKLNEEQINKLLEISSNFFVFSNSSLRKFEQNLALWIETAEQVRSFFLEKNHLPTTNENKLLYYWIHKQKKLFNDSKLGEKQTNILLNIYPDFFKMSEAYLKNNNISYWFIEANKIKDYYLNNFCLPDYNNNKNLFLWIDRQKKDYLKNKLCEKKYSFLLSITPDFFEAS